MRLDLQSRTLISIKGQKSEVMAAIKKLSNASLENPASHTVE